MKIKELIFKLKLYTMVLATLWQQKISKPK